MAATRDAVAQRLVSEVIRICEKSDRIQQSGQVQGWELTLARHRLQKCLHYYRLGSSKGRTELHSNLSVIVYRYIAPHQSHLGFQARYLLIEDFLQDFYAESLKAFRREYDLPSDYRPRYRLELAEYMAFSEHYAKRNITLPMGYSQQLIVLRAQSFGKRLPNETVVDIDQTLEFNKGEEGEHPLWSVIGQQMRNKLISESKDPGDGAIRDRLIQSLFDYFEHHGHQDCADYLTLKLQDCNASEIDEILQLTPRQRDYLQQRFKYHVDKFARSSHWRLVHQWLGAEVEQRLGLNENQWLLLLGQLDGIQREIVSLHQRHLPEQAIADQVGLSVKKVQKAWTEILNLAWQMRNEEEKEEGRS